MQIMQRHSLTEPADVSWGDDSTTLAVVVVAVDDVIDVIAVVVLLGLLKEEEDEEVSMEGASTWADWLMAVVASFFFLLRK
jgi:hypothetical protein